MKKRYMRIISLVTAVTVFFGAAAYVPAFAAEAPIDAATAADSSADTPDEGTGGGDDPADAGSKTGGESTPEDTPSQNQDASGGTDKADGQSASKDQDASGSGDTPSSESGSEPETEKKESGDVSGSITSGSDDVKGSIMVEEDKNDDKVEIKKNDRPYLALGENLSPEQRSTVLALMGIDESRLSDYDVVYVNNAEEHQYLDSYIDSSKIGTKSLSSIVIVEREEGSGINISTNNISYCTVGMYKNALATAGIQNADIIVAGPFPISGTAALVGVFKAYKEMTGDEIDEENIDAALHELVVTGALEASGGEADEVEGMIAYVKQAVVEHDLSDESEIRKAIEEGCEKFGLTLTDEEKGEIVGLMQKISELDLDLDGLLNAAQSIYDKISNADGGFWAKIRELLQTLWEKIKELF